jgi:phosphatidate cytidylyltransferase
MSESNEHSQRIKTAVMLVGGVLLIALLNIPLLTWAALGVVYYLAMDEAVDLFQLNETISYPIGVALWVVAGLYPHAGALVILTLLGFGAWVAYSRSTPPRNLLPLLYPTIGLLYIWTLYRGYGMGALMWMFVLVALTDIGAYYTGKSIGKTPFSPTSPNKTLEGVFGGVIAGTVGGLIATMIWMDIGFLAALIISLIASKMSIFGDLFESYLKREAGVKDSGTILPGHGGVLDRIDGYLFAAPAIYTLLKIFGY